MSGTWFDGHGLVSIVLVQGVFMLPGLFYCLVIG